MAGHSKWANIQHRKGAQDKKRGKIFTKLIREITVAAKNGPDPSANPRLRLAIDKALSANMTKDTIERAVKRGAGDGDAEQLDEVRYEGYGVGGVAVMVDAMTDNRNRTVAEVRHAFNKHGGNLGTEGSVAFQFANQGYLVFADDIDEDALLEAALEAGAEDVMLHNDGSLEVIVAAEQFVNVKETLSDAGFSAEGGEVTMRANIEVDVDLEVAQTLIKMIDMLEDLDDVQAVYTNANIPAEAYQ
ncbi:MAG: YebC/PmpR family DNA-binding transcriptional regulator [Gammaproteobacteria bacterium]|nr:YebC/PmpR family DNA-binding transcriptional regulator [Gammaproteobacteria bacterium]